MEVADIIPFPTRTPLKSVSFTDGTGYTSYCPEGRTDKEWQAYFEAMADYECRVIESISVGR